MLELRATIELNTPALGGGSEPRNADAYNHLRPSAVRGALRAWFRANVAGSLWPARGLSQEAQSQRNDDMVADLRKLEERIFGSTTLRSSISLAPPRGGHVQAWNPQPRLGSGLGYLGYGVFDAKRAPPTKLTTREGALFELSFAVRPCKNAKLTAEQILPVLASSIWLWCAFGGVGARWRRGFGSMRLVNLAVVGGGEGPPLLRSFSSLTTLPASHDDHLLALQRGLHFCHQAVEGLCRATGVGNAMLSNDAVRPHPQIRTLAGIKALRTLVPASPDPLIALEAAGNLLLEFRSSLKRKEPLPDYHAVKASIRDRQPAKGVARAAFGLPLGFFFRSLGNEQTRFVPQSPGGLDIKIDRVPSPLVIRVHALRGSGRRPHYGVTLINMAGKDTTPLLGCGVQQHRMRGSIEPPEAAILDDFIAYAVEQSKKKNIMAPPPRNRGRRR